MIVIVSEKSLKNNKQEKMQQVDDSGDIFENNDKQEKVEQI